MECRELEIDDSRHETEARGVLEVTNTIQPPLGRNEVAFRSVHHRRDDSLGHDGVGPVVVQRLTDQEETGANHLRTAADPAGASRCIGIHRPLLAMPIRTGEDAAGLVDDGLDAAVITNRQRNGEPHAICREREPVETSHLERPLVDAG